MADVLKSTNWWSANPPAATVVAVTGSAGEARLITAAEAHDANDTTYEGLTVNGDGVSIDGHGTLSQVQAITAAVGGIAYLRVKWRGRAVLTGTAPSGVANLSPLVNGVQGTPQALAAAFTNYQADFPTDPATGLAWTPASVSVASFGYFIDATATSASFNGVNTVRVAEFTVEVWGTDVTRAATAQASLGATALPSEALTIDKGNRDPSSVVQIGAQLDQGSALVTVRSFKASLSDQSTSTKDTFTSPASWPNSGTQLQPLYGAGSQGVAGSSGAGNGINGTGLISGIKLFALVRVAKHPASPAITNIRFGTPMGVQALVAPPTVRDITLALTEDMWEVVSTALITTGQFANPFTWGNGVDSVWASLFGWTFNHTYSNTVTPQSTQVEVAEAWVEIYGPAGMVSEGITLTHALGLPPKLQPMQSTL